MELISSILNFYEHSEYNTKEKYIDAFKPTLLTYYTINRINLTENLESVEISSKEDMEEDERRKKQEIKNLGLLSNFLLENSNANAANAKNDKKGESFPNFVIELSSIEDKVKAECSKIYTGEYAKLINNPGKIPLSFIPFLQNIKDEMENFRIKCIRDLRTFVKYFLI